MLNSHLQSADSSLCNCHPLSCIHLLFWLCFQAFGRHLVGFFPSQTCISLRHFVQLHQNRWANANSSRKLFGFPSLFCRYPAVLLSFVILLDIAHVVAGYRELAKGIGANQKRRNRFKIFYTCADYSCF